MCDPRPEVNVIVISLIAFLVVRLMLIRPISFNEKRSVELVDILSIECVSIVMTILEYPSSDENVILDTE